MILKHQRLQCPLRVDNGHSADGNNRASKLLVNLVTRQTLRCEIPVRESSQKDSIDEVPALFYMFQLFPLMAILDALRV